MSLMFRIVLSILLVFSIVRFLRYAWPVRSLSYIKAREVRVLAVQSLDMKMLDVRDAVDYEKDSIRGSINISLGRLAFVWQHCLSPDDSVLILAESYYKRNKAARILYKQGFRKLYAVNGDFLGSKKTLSDISVKGCCEGKWI
ncbi:rhodanese-like domain-containing protein [Paenibacillus sp. FSL E2-0201]|uniref:rhodanese-like domain-containing protein n=1 Tax=Paenibacillus sp. FSL E2-0201 TaxID=2954726 RepID=UPI0030DBEB36